MSAVGNPHYTVEKTDAERSLAQGLTSRKWQRREVVK